MEMIIIDMQMPEKCGLCPCFHFENPMYCQAVKADKNKKIINPYGLPRPEWCPLKEHEAVNPCVAVDTWICPKCGHTLESQYLIDDKDSPCVLVHDRYSFCPNCGRAVKWHE